MYSRPSPISYARRYADVVVVDDDGGDVNGDGDDDGRERVPGFGLV